MTKKQENLKQPLVSVVIPVYNGGEYFPTCLESVLNQTYQNWECVINNNSSEDDTLEVANSYAKKDKRFKVFSNEEFLSQVDNWNKACTNISPDAKYMKVLGADDYLFPEHIEKMIDIMDKNPNVGICSSFRLIGTEVDMDGLNIWDGNVYNGKEILYRQLTRTLDISGSNSTVMFSVEHLKKIPRYPVIFDNSTIHEDTQLEYEIMNISDVGFVFQVLSYTRRHEKAGTLTTVFRYNTLLQFNEKILYDFKGDDKKLNTLWRLSRYRYAFFLFYKTITLDRASIKWHKKYMIRKPKFYEYLIGLLILNKLSQIFTRILGKIFK